MDQICSIAPAEHIEEIRNVVVQLSHFTNSTRLLAIELSPNGNLPATHYFCSINYTKKLYDDIMAFKKSCGTDYTEVMVVADPREFLISKNLKVVKK